MVQERVEQLLEEAFAERSDLFLLELKVTPDNAISVVIDGDQGVMVEDCMYISRAIEHNLDRDVLDFSLEVLSAGATAPLRFPRQYYRHKGRHLQIKTTAEDKVEGELEAVDEQGVVLKWKTREPKPVGKGKTTVVKEAKIAFEDIKEAKVKIKF